MTVVTLTPENIGAYAETLVRQVRPGGHELDYSEASVAILEELLQNSDGQFQDPDFPDAQRNIVVFYNGCYLGETLARNLHGVWQFAENWADSTLTFALPDGGGVQTQPFLKLWRRITEGPLENDLTEYYDGLKERLADSADISAAP
jgi:hypothetical protein